VHVRGKLRELPGSDGKETVLKKLIRRHDPEYVAVWDSNLSEGYKEKMKAAIVAFEVDVAEWSAKFKLSQNRALQDRLGVMGALEKINSDKAESLIQWMKELGLDKDSPKS